jgi:hypothetical protein
MSNPSPFPVHLFLLGVGSIVERGKPPRRAATLGEVLGQTRGTTADREVRDWTPACPGPVARKISSPPSASSIAAATLGDGCIGPRR